jgi:hypothetical protein
VVSAGIGTARAAQVGLRQPTRRLGRRRLDSRSAPLVLFWLLPAACFAVLTAAGHPPFVADDVLQNYPLRVLVGQLLRHGSAPLWNPYIWAGSPLLAGSNAGAAYPGTLLFAVLPGPWAWTVNVAAVFGLAGTGMYRLLRDRALVPTAALAGGLAFAYGGFLTGQLEHIGLIQGAALLPWLLLSTRRLDRPRWAAGFAALLALVILTGEPRAATLAAVVGVAGIAEAWFRHEAPRARYALGSAAGLLLAAVLSAVYWLPGLAAVTASQRGHASFGFFSSGSLEPSWLVLLLVPYLMGSGNHLWHPYFGPYNISEISGYAGLLALLGAGALLPTVVRHLAGWRRLLVWYALLIAGLLLALGGNTPLGHLLAHLPVYGAMRLQSRNIGLVAFALAGLLGYWVNSLLDGPDPAGTRPAPSRLWCSLPALLTAALATLALAAPGVAADVLQSPWSAFRSMWGYYLLSVALAAAAGWLARSARRLPPRRRQRTLLAFLLVDLGLSVAGQAWIGATPAQLAGAGTPARALAALVGPSGRFAVYDPWLSHSHELQLLGATDVNVLRRLPSVQGYGSVVSARYDAATGAHQQDSLALPAVAGTALDRLGLTVLLAPSAAFLVPAGTPEVAPPQPVPAPLPVPPNGTAGRFLGTPRPVDRVLLSAPGLTGAAVTVELQRPDGNWVAGRGRLVDGIAQVQFPSRPVAVALRVRGRGLTVSAIDVVSGSAPYALDGPLAPALSAGHWRYAGTFGSYAAYTNLRAAAPWAVSGRGARIVWVSSEGAAGVRPWAPVRVEVTSPGGSLLVRAEAWAPGWIALARGPAGARTLPVGRDGLIQSVRVPPGTWTLTFSYRPARVLLGAWLTGAGVLALIAVFVAGRARHRREP